MKATQVSIISDPIIKDAAGADSPGSPSSRVPSLQNGVLALPRQQSRGLSPTNSHSSEWEAKRLRRLPKGASSTTLESGSNKKALRRMETKTTLLASAAMSLPDARAVIRHESADTPADQYAIRLQMVNPEKYKKTMGCIERSYVTGKACVLDSELAFEATMDFSVVDLYRRSAVAGTPMELAKDAYLLKPIPMGYRTWMYHFFYRAGLVLNVTEMLRQTGDGDGMVTYVLKLPCIDVPVSAGRWSPVLFMAPMAMALTATADMLQVCAMLIVLIVVVAVSKVLNTPMGYYYTRPFTFPLRAGLIIYLMLSFSTSTTLKFFGYALALLAGFLDLILGDGGMLSGVKHECHYEVSHLLPNRIFLCRRSGAASMSQHRRLKIPEGLTGMGAWESDMAMIADVNGFLVELVPLTLEDWKHIEEKYMREGKLIQCLSLGPYHEGARNFVELQKESADVDMPTLEIVVEAPHPPAKPAAALVVEEV